MLLLALNVKCFILSHVSSFPFSKIHVACYFWLLPFHCQIYSEKFPSVPKKVREKSRECHNHKPQPIPDRKRKRKQTKPNKRTSNKCRKSTKSSSLFSKRGNSNAKRTEKYKNKITQARHKTNRLVEKNTKQQNVRLTPGPGIF